MNNELLLTVKVLGQNAGSISEGFVV